MKLESELCPGLPVSVCPPPSLREEAGRETQLPAGVRCLCSLLFTLHLLALGRVPCWPQGFTWD